MLQRTLSLPTEGIKTIDDIKFDLMFEHSPFITKWDSYLSQVVVDIEGLNTFVPKGFSGFSKQNKNEFWDVLCDHIREKLKFFEILRNIDPLDFLDKRNFEALSQDYQNFMSSISS